MKNLFSILFLALGIFSSAMAQKNPILNQKTEIIKNQSQNLSKLLKIVNIIDDDVESYWAYGEAEKLLQSISKSSDNYYVDQAKIYAAYTHIFYGMSYTRSLNAIVRGDDYSLQELNSTLIRDFEIKDSELKKLSALELSSIYSVINFYKVSRMPRYPDMFHLYQVYSEPNEHIFKDYPAVTAYKIMSLNTKKLHYKIFANLIIDIYLRNNPGESEEFYTNYFNQLNRLGKRMDKIPSNSETIGALSDKDYYNYTGLSSEVQNEMIGLLVDQLKILEKRT